MILETDRLRLRPWTESDIEIFSALHADNIVMADQGGPLTRSESHEKLLRYVSCYLENGYSRWYVETKEGDCVGYCGIMKVTREHPLGPHDEIGWRLFRKAWSCGYATEAANAALADEFDRLDLPIVYSYTASDNERSQAVMKRLELIRESSLDFIATYPKLGKWRGLVWKTSDYSG